MAQKPRPNRTYKLGDIVPQDKTPDQNPSPFNFDRRLPGWHPDNDAEDVQGNPQPKPLLIEEAIFKSEKTGRFGPFPVPGQKTGAGVPFAEPSPGASDADWHSFNKWILGETIPETPDDVRTEAAMTTMLRQLAVLVRKYNASLYRLRRLHFYVYGRKPSDPPDHVPLLPPRNKFGDPELPPSNGKTLEQLIGEAEDDWVSVTGAIEDFITNKNGPHRYVKLDDKGYEIEMKVLVRVADMVEVNEYVVSMRIIAEVKEPGMQLQQTGYSSSSHVSISSAFSSS